MLQRLKWHQKLNYKIMPIVIFKNVLNNWEGWQKYIAAEGKYHKETV
jgi:hypothetical protein